MAPPSIAACPGCGAPRSTGGECLRCGIIYARARPLPPPTTDGPAEERLRSAPPVSLVGATAARRELRVQRLALPLALATAWALLCTGPGQFLLRAFLSMWLHELGHAAAALLCGHAALPGPWLTWWSEGRSPQVVLLLAGGLGGVSWLGWRRRRSGLMAAGLAGLAVQLSCTLLPLQGARALITFAGDGGGMILGTLLATAIFGDPAGWLGRGSLRFGFLAIGAASLVDPLRTWAVALYDPRELPLGRIEGAGLSDASTLIERYGWAPEELSRTYVLLGLLCLAALAVGWAFSGSRARARLAAATGG